MSHPPGYENIAFLYLPSNAPASITDERILFIKSGGISNFSIFDVSIFIFPFFFSIFAPNVSSILYIIWVSCMCGTLYSVVFPAFNIVAAIIGSDEFFDPDIFTEPSNFWPPSIM